LFLFKILSDFYKLFNSNYNSLFELMIVFFCRYRNRPIMSAFGLYDATSIMNADMLRRYQREGYFKLSFYVFAFFYYFVGLVICSHYTKLINVCIYLSYDFSFQNDTCIDCCVKIISNVTSVETKSSMKLFHTGNR